MSVTDAGTGTPNIGTDTSSQDTDKKDKSMFTTGFYQKLLFIILPLAMIGGYYIAKQQKANVWIFTIAAGILSGGIWRIFYGNARDKENEEVLKKFKE